jgi:hypothetical protein
MKPHYTFCDSCYERWALNALSRDDQARQKDLERGDTLQEIENDDKAN